MHTKRRTIVARGQSSEYAPRSTLHAQRVSDAQRAFTLVELLVVISIIALLLGIIVPSYFSIREKAKYTKAKVTAKNLETAFKAYLDHYRVWPSVIAWPAENNGDGIEIKDDLFQMLRGDDQPPGANPGHMPFYEFESTNITAGAIDPWSDPDPAAQSTWQRYRVRVDLNYDNQIQDTYRSVLVWSVGADRTNATSDDVRSWD